MMFKTLLKILLVAVSLLSIGYAKKDKEVKSKLDFAKNTNKQISYTEKEKIDRIMNFFKDRLKDINIQELKYVETIRANKGIDFDAFVFEFKVNDETKKEIVFVKDNFFFSDFVNLETLQTSSEKVKKVLEKEQNKKILAELKNDKQYIITLGSGKKEMYVFSDPLCPYCKKHIQEIDSKILEENTIHFVFTSVHQDEGFKRSALIYENIIRANPKDDMEKLAFIKTYYDNDIKQDLTFPENKHKINNLSQKYFDLGVTYVPYVIEMDKQK